MDVSRDRERVEALTVEWASWLTDAAHKWKSADVLKRFRDSVTRSCDWFAVKTSAIAETGILTLQFGVAADRILNDVPEANLETIVELINTEPGNEIGAKLEVDSFEQTFIVLERYYYIPVESRSDWLDSDVIPEREREFLKAMADLLNRDFPPDKRMMGFMKMVLIDEGD
jgi:hypothetical protein